MSLFRFLSFGSRSSEPLLRAIETALAENHLRLMASIQDLDTKIGQLTAAVSETATRVQADLDALTAKLAAGSAGPDVQPEIDRLQASIDALKAIDPAAAAPATEAPATESAAG